MADLGAAYAETKALLLGSMADQDWSSTVPATPDWDVADVVRHVTGLAVEAARGGLPADLDLLEQFRDDAVVAARDAFADGQVLRRRDAAPKAVIAEWDDAEPVLVDRLRHEAGHPEALPFGFDTVLVTDLCVHADDVALALGRPPHRETLASRVALVGYCFGVDYRLRAVGLPALTLRYDGKERTLGTGEGGAAVAANRWELLRVLAGRRSRSQIRGLAWTGDPEPYLPLLPAYGERSDPLTE